MMPKDPIISPLDGRIFVPQCVLLILFLPPLHSRNPQPLLFRKSAYICNVPHTRRHAVSPDPPIRLSRPQWAQEKRNAQKEELTLLVF